MPHDPSARRMTAIATALFSAIVVLVGADLVADYAEGTDVRHLVLEGAVAALAACGVGLMVVRLFRLSAETRSLGIELRSSRAEAERWKREAGDLLAGLGEAIDRQLATWELTGAEREVALLLLKGLSLKEVAEARGVSERTARHQARSVYRKGGLQGRAELSAFFLEDLLLPPRDTGDERRDD